MVAFGSISAWQPGRGPVTTWTASAASREAMAFAGTDPLPPSFQQAQHLRTAYNAQATGRDVPRLIMVSWDVDGWCDVSAMTEAINTHVRRHDTYHSRFEVSGDNAETIVRRTIDDADLIEFAPSAVGYMDTAEIRSHVVQTTPGTLDWDCFTFGVVQKLDHFTVYAIVDHLHTDGSSAGLIYADIHLSYQALMCDVPNPLPGIGGYRDFTTRQSLHVEAMTRDSRPIKDWIDFARDAEGHWPSFPLTLGDTSSVSAGRAVTFELLNDTQTEAFETACRAAGARFSGGVMACAALADHRFTGAETFHTFTPSDARNNESQALSAGWYASLFPVSVEIGDGDFSQMARAAQKSFDANKHMSAVSFDRVLELAVEGDLPDAVPRRPSMMVSLMDFRRVPDADSNRLGIFIDELSHGGINMWVSRTADQTLVSVSFPDTSEARHSVHHYVGVLREAFLVASERVDHAFAHTA